MPFVAVSPTVRELGLISAASFPVLKLSSTLPGSLPRMASSPAVAEPLRLGRQAIYWQRQALIETSVGLLVLSYYIRHFALRLADPDLWGRMAVGKLFLQQGAMPRTDPFAYTPTLPLWVDHEWLTGVVFYSLHQTFGEPGLIFVKTLTGLAALLFVWLTARLNGAARLPLFVVLALAMPVFGYGMMPRAGVYLFLFRAVAVPAGAVSSWKLKMATLFIPALYAALVQLAWRIPGRSGTACALHGGNAARSRSDDSSCANLRRLHAVTLVNPYGVNSWRYLIPAVLMHRPDIHEWSPVPLSFRYGQFWLLVIFCVIGLAQLRRRGAKWLARLSPLQSRCSWPFGMRGICHCWQSAAVDCCLALYYLPSGKLGARVVRGWP